MEEFRDFNNHLVCMGDPASGRIESAYKGYKTSTVLLKGESFTIERQGITTIIKRTENGEFSVESFI